MNCRQAQRLLSAERDGALAETERANLDAHIAQCAGCRKMRVTVAAAIDSWRAVVASVPIPDTERAWQDIHREIRTTRPDESRRSPAFWRWTVPLGAAAALLAAVGIIAPRWSEPPASVTTVARVQTARADFVEVSKDSSSVVYVDDKSGWLVVWAVDDTRPTKL